MAVTALSLYFVLSGGTPAITGVSAPRPTVAAVIGSTNTTGANVLADGAVVSKQEALEDVLALAKSQFGTQTANSGPGTDEQATILRRAVELGLIPTSQLPSASMAEPVSRAQFAEWLWKMFSPLFVGRSTITFSDLAELSAQERQAVDGLARAGIVGGYPDGTFRGNGLLSKGDEQNFLRQIEKTAAPLPSSLTPHSS